MGHRVATFSSSRSWDSIPVRSNRVWDSHPVRSSRVWDSHPVRSSRVWDSHLVRSSRVWDSRPVRIGYGLATFLVVRYGIVTPPGAAVYGLATQ